MSAVDDQIKAISDAQDATLEGLGIIGTDVANLVTEVTALQQAQQNQQPVDLSPLLTRATAINDKLNGVRTAAEAGQTPAPVAPADPPAVTPSA